jgi:transposase
MGEYIYTIDISRAQFEAIRALLESVRKKTKPRAVDWFVVGCALLYVLKGGLQWRRLPKDFLKWITVYGLFVLCAREAARPAGNPCVRAGIEASG